MHGFRLCQPYIARNDLCCRQSIFCDEVDFKRKSWDGITAEAKDFVALLLNKDPKKRPTAKQVSHAPIRRFQVQMFVLQGRS